jgi:heme O synthase-like polyprenyltransferase
MANPPADGQLQPGVRRGDGFLLSVTLVLAVVLSPIGLITALAFGLAARRQGDRVRASRFFMVAAVALVVLVVLCMVGLGVHAGSNTASTR